jgi:hypothetical protein
MGFRRIQINATAVNGVDTSNLKGSVQTLLGVISKYHDLEFIIQKNDETRPLWEGILTSDSGVPNNVTMLVDESKGTGLLASAWPSPPSEYDIGYAGGIGPKNIHKVLTDVLIAGNGRDIWIDMESSLRTIDKDGNDVFDLGKCFKCIDVVCEMGIYKHPQFMS